MGGVRDRRRWLARRGTAEERSDDAGAESLGDGGQRRTAEMGSDEDLQGTQKQQGQLFQIGTDLVEELTALQDLLQMGDGDALGGVDVYDGTIGIGSVDVCHEKAHGISVIARQAEDALDEKGEAGGGVVLLAALAEALVKLAGEVGGALVEEGAIEVFFALEVVVEDGFLHTSRVGNVLDGGARIATLAEQAKGGVRDAITRLGVRKGRGRLLVGGASHGLIVILPNGQ